MKPFSFRTVLRLNEDKSGDSYYTHNGWQLSWEGRKYPEFPAQGVGNWRFAAAQRSRKLAPFRRDAIAKKRGDWSCLFCSVKFIKMMDKRSLSVIDYLLLFSPQKPELIDRTGGNYLETTRLGPMTALTHQGKALPFIAQRCGMCLSA